MTISPPKTKGSPGEDEKGVVVGGVGSCKGHDCTEQTQGNVEEVVSEANPLGLLGFEFVVF